MDYNILFSGLVISYLFGAVSSVVFNKNDRISISVLAISIYSTGYVLARSRRDGRRLIRKYRSQFYS